MSLDDEFVNRNEEFRSSNETSHIFNKIKPLKDPSKGRPWRRFWARFLDTGIHVFPVAIAFEIVSPGFATKTMEKYGEYVLNVNYLPFVLILEVLVLSIFGSTLGKYLLNIDLISNDGSRVSFGSATVRGFSLWIKGLAFGLPLANMITAVAAASKIRKDGNAAWDNDSKINIEYRPLSMTKTALAVLLIAALIAFNAVAKNMK
jgi:uncharacterized RDD family membrane protein YckC